MVNAKGIVRYLRAHTRTWFQAAWFALTNGYARGYTSGKIFTGNSKVFCVPGLNCYSCPGALASCPIGALQAVLNKSSFKISLYVFGLLSMFGVLFGRFVCGWMCPFGLVQDLLYKIKIGPKHKNLPGHQYLRYLRFVVLGIMVLALPALVVGASGVGQPWFCEWICPSGTLLGGIPLVALNESFRQIIGFRFVWKVTLLVVICVGAILYYRPFCKYLCPLGAIYGVFNPVSTYRIEVDVQKCVKCRACQRACGMDIATFQTPNSMDCIRCGDCLHACPTGALQTTWAKTGKRVANRCFIDDETAARDTRSARNRVQPLTTLLGVLMVIGGLQSVFLSAVLNLYSDFNKRLNMEVMQGLNPASLILDVSKVFASLTVLLAGIYILINRADANKAKSVAEKLRIAHRVYLVGLVIVIVGMILDIRTLTMVLSTLIVNFYCLLCLPFVRGFGSCVEREIEEGSGSKTTRVYAALSCLFTLMYVGVTVGSIIWGMTMSGA